MLTIRLMVKRSYTRLHAAGMVGSSSRNASRLAALMTTIDGGPPLGVLLQPTDDLPSYEIPRPPGRGDCCSKTLRERGALFRPHMHGWRFGSTRLVPRAEREGARPDCLHLLAAPAVLR